MEITRTLPSTGKNRVSRKCKKTILHLSNSWSQNWLQTNMTPKKVCSQLLKLTQQLTREGNITFWRSLLISSQLTCALVNPSMKVKVRDRLLLRKIIQLKKYCFTVTSKTAKWQCHPRTSQIWTCSSLSLAIVSLRAAQAALKMNLRRTTATIAWSRISATWSSREEKENPFHAKNTSEDALGISRKSSHAFTTAVKSTPLMPLAICTWEPSTTR